MLSFEEKMAQGNRIALIFWTSISLGAAIWRGWSLFYVYFFPALVFIVLSLLMDLAREQKDKLGGLAIFFWGLLWPVSVALGIYIEYLNRDLD